MFNLGVHNVKLAGLPKSSLWLVWKLNKKLKTKKFLSCFYIHIHQIPTQKACLRAVGILLAIARVGWNSNMYTFFNAGLGVGKECFCIIFLNSTKISVWQKLKMYWFSFIKLQQGFFQMGILEYIRQQIATRHECY